MTTPISTIVTAVRDRYIESGAANTPEQLNNGYCVNIAEDLEMIIKSITTTGKITMLTTDDLIKETDAEDGWVSGGFDTYDLNQCLMYDSPPPFNLSGEQLGKIITGYHAWIYADGKHYDAECPEGVGNLFDLPIHKRAILASAMSKNI